MAASSGGDSEVGKLQKHLSLLREQYVKLQARLAEVEKAHAAASTAAGQIGVDHFVPRLLRTVEELFDKDTYSDIKINLAGRIIPGHRLVLAARGGNWGVTDLAQVTELTLADLPHEVGWALLKWVYTDRVDIRPDINFTIEVMRAAHRFRLEPLKIRCEHALMALANVSNCTSLFRYADEAGAQDLRRTCLQLILTYWTQIDPAQFDTMPAPLLFEVFKQITAFTLHLAVSRGREDVVFLFLIENDTNVVEKINEVDEKGDVALHLALLGRHESIAETLVDHGCDVDSPQATTNKTLLHRALERKDETTAAFLVSHGASVNAVTSAATGSTTPLHIASKLNLPVTAKLLINSAANVNAQDASGATALHVSIGAGFAEIVNALLAAPAIDLSLKDNLERTTLWLALVQRNEQLASTLVAAGCDTNAPDNLRNTLLHHAIQCQYTAAALFLISNGASVDAANAAGTTPLHLAALFAYAELATTLLNAGAKVNVRDSKGRTPLHNAIRGDNGSQPLGFPATPVHVSDAPRRATGPTNPASEDVARRLIRHAGVDLNARDEEDNTPLGLALLLQAKTIATALVEAGADKECVSAQGGYTLLHQAILRKDAGAARFLLEAGSSINSKTGSNQSPLMLAITNEIGPVVEVLCSMGADPNGFDNAGNTALWTALTLRQADVASTLVKYRADVDAMNAQGEALLHSAIRKRDSFIATFLIGNGAKVNARSSKGQCTPLHLAAEQGLEDVCVFLLQNGADINAQESQGLTPLHVAVESRHPTIVQCLLHQNGVDLTIVDGLGATPFATALNTKDLDISALILSVDASVAEQADDRGRNFLHQAIAENDVDRVLFLIELKVDVNSRVQDAEHLTPLFLAVRLGAEAICKHLIQAGADVNARDGHDSDALHVACSLNLATVVNLLVEAGADLTAVDSDRRTALHLAVANQHINVVRRLVKESAVDLNARDAKSQTVLHVLAAGAAQNAIALLDVLLQFAGGSLDINAVDIDGNTPLFYAFGVGHELLCVALVKAGAQIGLQNKAGKSVMDEANKGRIQRKIIDAVPAVLTWLDGKACQNCNDKFSVSKRKHHCRHCARVLCSKCCPSDKEVLLAKFDEKKPARVCDACHEVLSAPF
ncbi:hypothetical protein CAOG_007172 [Capsaspora owczarzaki ATCC 30864]|uniref:Ankyrin repeat and FYVE domain-containing protein 1 n=2 Tax=Capsaspora owczarzaki (strain ATCC 30864) TaxID=595528 RepID=A0A0D2WVN3_CAPO3|nr:hypothetical protein CAOG_007172 [Capsaspora owczarzaki ATCC 30864]